MKIHAHIKRHEHDIPVKCCRCRNKHMESERHDVPKKGCKGVTESVCPCCGGKNYYNMRPMFAWCWKTGLIEFGEVAPKDEADGSGCIVFASGPEAFLKGRVSTLARHGQGASTGKLLVPGVPEAEGKTAAVDALCTWVEWAAKGNGCRGNNGVVFHARDPRGVPLVPMGEC